MPSVSLVVPARDVVDYVALLLDDLRHQTFSDLEVLVVDDGSVDGTADVIDRIVDEDDRFRAIDGGGRGPSAARNLGLGLATGEFIAFVDADDRVAPTYVERLRASLDGAGSDLAVCNARRLTGYETRTSGLHLRSFADPRPRTHLRAAPELVYDSTIWNKLIRRELWERDPLRFDEGRWINDVYPSLRSHVLAASISMVDDHLYHWRVRSEPSTSITDSKLTDPVARVKSLEDRAFAVQRTRRMLATDLPDPVVLARFDERVLTHDYWTYLPHYPDSDDTFRKTLIEDVAEYLDVFDVDLQRLALGPVLQAAYRAIRDGDVEQVDGLLAPEVHALASTRRGRLSTAVHPPQRAAVRRVRSLATGLARRRGPEPSLSIDARISHVQFDPHTASPLQVRGTVRIRDGRSDVEGAWGMVLALEGARKGGRVAGPAFDVAVAEDEHLHPLQRTGWRPFSAALDPAEVKGSPDERVWRLVLEAVLDGRRLAVRSSTTVQAARTLGIGRPLDGSTDLVAFPRRGGELELRREAAAPRLLRASFDGDGSIDLSLEPTEPEETPTHLWIAPPGGGPPASPLRYPDLAHLEIPDDGDGRWELWCRSGANDHRVRAHHSFVPASTSTDARPGYELSIRPTVRGRVVVERRRPHAIIGDASVDADAGDVVLRGPALPRAVVDASIIAVRCLWTREAHGFQVTSGGDGWWARMPLATLIGRDGSVPVARAWTLRIVDRDGSSTPVHVGPDRRERFPLVAQSPIGDVELKIAASSRAVLWARPSGLAAG